MMGYPLPVPVLVTVLSLSPQVSHLCPWDSVLSRQMICPHRLLFPTEALSPSLSPVSPLQVSSPIPFLLASSGALSPSLFPPLSLSVPVAVSSDPVSPYRAGPLPSLCLVWPQLLPGVDIGWDSAGLWLQDWRPPARVALWQYQLCPSPRHGETRRHCRLHWGPHQGSHWHQMGPSGQPLTSLPPPPFPRSPIGSAASAAPAIGSSCTAAMTSRGCSYTSGHSGDRSHGNGAGAGGCASG